jgi:hypothetical protein
MFAEPDRNTSKPVINRWFGRADGMPFFFAGVWARMAGRPQHNQRAKYRASPAVRDPHDRVIKAVAIEHINRKARHILGNAAGLLRRIERRSEIYNPVRNHFGRDIWGTRPRTMRIVC